MPLAEQDVQSVFINSISIHDRKLWVRNEAGRNYRVDLVTGHVDGAARYWIPWLLVGTALTVAGYIFWKVKQNSSPSHNTRLELEND